MCPVGHVTARETLTPHAWALTIDSVKRGNLQWNAESADVLYACADCGLCRAHCKTDQPLPDAIVRARAEVVAAGAAPSIVGEIDARLRRWANPYVDRSPEPDDGAGDVAVFVGDVAAHRSPAAVEAAIALLEAAGVRAVRLGAGRSTGQLASSLGLQETARSLASAVIDLVRRSGCRELLVLGPGEVYTFRHVYGDRLGLAWPEDVPVREVSDVLAEAASQGRLGFAQPAGREADGAAYTYYDPCQGPRIGRDGRASRTLLAAALGASAAREMFWREDRSHPCGAIGGLEFTQPAIAAQLTEARLADAARAGASSLITDDPGCLHQLQSRKAPGIAVLGLYELLRDRLA